MGYNSSMIEIVNNNINRGGTRIGRIDGNHIRDRADNTIGYFSGNDIFKAGESMRIAHIDGDYIQLRSDPDHRGIHIEDNLKEVSGGNISDVCRAAIRLLLG